MNVALLDRLMESPWLERVGWTLLHFVWQGVLVAVGLAAVLALLRRSSARMRYLVSISAVGVAVVLPLATFLLSPLPRPRQAPDPMGRAPGNVLADHASVYKASGPAEIKPGRLAQPRPASTATRNPPAPARRSISATAAMRGAYRAIMVKAAPLLPWCTTVWAIGVVMLSLRLLVGWTQVRRLCRQGTRPADPHWQASLEVLSGKLRLKRTIRLLESTLAEVPAVIGWLQPIILLPIGALAGLSTAQVEMILAHELAHIARQDYLVNLGLTVFETLGFYHPAVRWLAARVRQERENACDDLALAVTGEDRLGYARALATLEAIRGQPGGLALAANSGGRGMLLARVRRLLGAASARRPGPGRSSWWLAGAIALVIALALVLGVMQHPANAQGTDQKQPPLPALLRGRVVDEQGRPVPGALVYDEAGHSNPLAGGLKEPTMTDANGFFFVPKLRSNHSWRTLGARLEDTALGWLQIGAEGAPAVLGENGAIVKPIVLQSRRFRLYGICVDELGRPLAGATVAVTSLPAEAGDFTLTPGRPEETISLFWEALTTKSDAAGEFSLQLPVEDDMIVEISAPGRETVFPFETVAAGEHEIGDLGKVKLPAAGSIAGRVAFADGEGGKRSLQGMIFDAVEAGELQKAAAAGPAGWFGPPEHANDTLSDAAGHYRIEHLPPGTYTVFLDGIDGETYGNPTTAVLAAENVVVRAGETTPLDLRAVPGRILRVQAFDKGTGQPIRNRPSVHYEGPGRPHSAGLGHSTVLTETGEWEFKVPPGHSRVFLTGAVGSGTSELASGEVDVPADRDPPLLRLEVRENAQLSLAGHVQDVQGRPIPLETGAVVQLLGSGPDKGRDIGGSQGSNGTFQIAYKQVGSHVRLVVDVPGFRPWLSPEFVLTDQPEPMTVALQECPMLTVRGRVLDQDGKPVDRANVLGTIITAEGPAYTVRLGSGVPADELFTDQDGRFETHRLRAGDKFRLDVFADGKEVSASADGVQVDRGSHCDIQMNATTFPRVAATGAPIGPHDLAGHVVDGQGKPVADATVTVAGSFPEVAPVITNAAGGFRFPDFGDRHYVYLSAEKAGFGTRWETDLAVGRDFEVRLDNTTRLRGVLLQPDGSPAGRATIVLRKNKPTTRSDMNPITGLRLQRESDERGVYDFPLEPGDYEAEITSANGNLVARDEDVQVAAGQSLALPPTLNLGLTLRVQTVDSVTGKPAPGVKFNIREMVDAYVLQARPGSERQSDAQGFVQWEHLFPGTTILETDRTGVYGRFWSTDDREALHLNAPKGRPPVGNECASGSLFMNPVPGRAAEPIIVQAERAVKIRGQVLDPDGKPAINVQVRAITYQTDQKPAGDEPAGDLPPFSAYTQDSFFSGYIPAGNGELTRMNGFPQDDSLASGVSEPFASAPGDAREVIIKLTRGGWIDGRVIDAHGKPLADVNVVATAQDRLDSFEFRPWTKTGPQGEFHFGPLRPAEYQVRTTTLQRFAAGDEPPQEARLVTVTAGGHVQTGALHFGTAGWTNPPNQPAAPSPTRAANAQAAPSPAPMEMLTARVKVVDADGKPIAGATITPDGLRTRIQNGSFYGWRRDQYGPPIPAITDASGIAAVRYPRYADENMATGAISFRVEHPDYSAARPTSYLVVDDPAQAVPLVLHRGATLRLSGHLAGSGNAVPVYPQQADSTYDSHSPSAWKDVGGNVLETHQLPAGRNYLRLAHVAADGALFFSDTKLLPTAAGETYTLDLELRPGVRVEGALDPSVPRPVQHGRVVIHTYATGPETDATWMGWFSWRDVAADGTFVFESLPPGELEVAAICDGYTSASMPDGRFGSTQNVPPQFALLAGQTTHAEIKMQPAAACRVEMHDATGLPVRGARVGFAPNVRWTPGLSTIFCDAAFKMDERIARWRDVQASDYARFDNLFEAVSDENGIATVRNLPAGNGIFFGVRDDRYQPFPPADRSAWRDDREGIVDLTPGGTATVKVQLQKKGENAPPAAAAAEEPAPTAAPGAPTPAPRPPGEPSANFALSVNTLPNAPDTFSGRVIGEDGAGLPGVNVKAWTWCPGNEAVTDANGDFRLQGLEPKRQIEVRFSKDGYTPRLIVKQPLGAIQQPLTLTRHTYFEGTVITPDGKPAAGASIRANQGPKDADGVHISEIWIETQADDLGHYRLYAQDDRYDFQVTTKAGDVARLPNTDISDGEIKRLDITLQAGVVFRARIVDSVTGAPVPGAKLSNWQHPGVEGLSDENGQLEIRGLLPGKFEFDVAAAGFTRWWSAQCVSPWARFQGQDNPTTRWQRNFDALDYDLQTGLEPVTITLERGVRITGRAFDPEGQPAVGATVAPALTGTGNSLTGDTRFSVETKPDGTFEMLLPASKEAAYNLEVHDGKYGEWRRWANGVLPPIHTNPGQTLSGLEIRLTRPGVARGQVLDSTGKPVAGKDVRAQAADGLENRYYDPTTTTDKDGRFELKFLRPGSQLIQAEPFWLKASEAPAGTSRTVDVTEGGIVEGVDLREQDTLARSTSAPKPLAATSPAAAPEKQAVRAVIQDEANHPIPGAEVTLNSIKKGQTTTFCGLDQKTMTDAKGEFTLRPADSDGVYSVRVTAPGCARSIFGNLTPGAAPTVLHLKRGAAVTGQVLMADAKPAAAVKIVLVQADRDSFTFVGTYEVSTDAQGRFRCEGLQPSLRYDLAGPMNQPKLGEVLPTRSVTAGAAGSTLDVGVSALTAGCRIRGRVKLADGAALPKGSYLLLTREHAWDDQRVELPADGRFDFQGVPVESITFSASVPGYANLNTRVKEELRSNSDTLERNPAAILQDPAEFARSGANWRLQVTQDLNDVELLLHSDPAIKDWLAGQFSGWIEQVLAAYPQGTAGLSLRELREMAVGSEEMTRTPPQGQGAEPHPPVTWQFVLSSGNEAALADVARRAQGLGFQIYSTGKLADTEALAQFPASLRDAIAPNRDKLLAVELRVTEPSSAESFFQHELALRRLLKENDAVKLTLTGRVVPTVDPLPPPAPAATVPVRFVDPRAPLDSPSALHLRGVIHAKDGQAVPDNVTIQLEQRSPVASRFSYTIAHHSLGRDLAYTLEGTSGGSRASLLVDAPGFRTWQSAEFAVTAGMPPIDAELEPAVPAPVRGRVVDAAGIPVAGAKVSATVMAPEGGQCGLQLAPDGTELSTDAQGRFETSRLRVGDTFSLWAHDSDFKTPPPANATPRDFTRESRSETLIIADATGLDVPDLALQPFRRLPFDKHSGLPGDPFTAQDKQEQLQALAALGDVDDPRAQHMIMIASLASRQAPFTPAEQAVIARFLDSNNPEVLFEAARRLQRMNEPAVLAKLAALLPRMLDQPNEAIELAVWLRRGSVPGASDRAFELFSAWLRDPATLPGPRHVLSFRLPEAFSPKKYAPLYVDLLADADTTVSYNALGRLEELTDDQSFGFDPARAPAEQSTVLARWREWLAQSIGSLPEDTPTEKPAAAKAPTWIGARILADPKAETGIWIATLVPGSPAEKAGLRPGDIITAVDGRTLAGRSADQVAAHELQGEAGTPLRLTLHRQNVARPLDIAVVPEPRPATQP